MKDENDVNFCVLCGCIIFEGERHIAAKHSASEEAEMFRASFFRE
jgi:hypothetical protein